MVKATLVKAYLKGKGLRASKNLIDALDSRIIALLDQAAVNTEGDKRKTVRDTDI